MQLCAVFLLLATFSLIIITAGLMVGTRSLSLQQLWPVLNRPDGHVESILVWKLRLPRSLAAFFAGAGLALSGYILQALTRNPLAGPGLTGVSAGAITPIVFCFVYLPAISSIYYPFIGMIGGLTAASITLLIARGGNGHPLHLALGGISVSLFLNAVITYIILASGAQVPSLLFWLTGGLQGRSWPQLLYMLPWVIIALCGTCCCQRILSLLSLPEQVAAGMGLQTNIWKPFLLLLAVLPVAGIAPVAGPVAFVGLAAPHIARLLSRNNQTQTILLCFFLGGNMVSLADIIARTIAAPQELPVSIVTALTGGPVFIYLAQKRSVSSQGNCR
ncbi:putative siderophore transport system permease protein YfiZ [Paenochrobactrum sp. BZR 201-1]